LNSHIDLYEVVLRGRYAYNGGWSFFSENQYYEYSSKFTAWQFGWLTASSETKKIERAGT